MLVVNSNHNGKHQVAETYSEGSLPRRFNLFSDGLTISRASKISTTAAALSRMARGEPAPWVIGCANAKGAAARAAAISVMSVDGCMTSSLR